MTDRLREVRRSIFSHFIKPAIDSRARGLVRRMARFEHAERQSRDQLQALQWAALQHLLHHAYETCPFYKRRFEAQGIHPMDIKSLKDFVAIPPLTRDDILNDPDGLVSTQFPRASLQKAATGGTTDTPMQFYRDAESLREKTALHHRFNSWAGLETGDRVFYLWGAASDYATNPSWRWRLYERHVLRQIFAPAAPLTTEVFTRNLALLNDFRPQVIYAYPTPLSLLAEYLRASGHQYHKPVSIICTAEALTDPQRALIEEVFECKVFEFYGAREFGIIAANCEQHEGMHWNPLATLLDFVPLPGGAGEGIQEMFVTDLLGRAMPLIRYRVNDCAAPNEQPCGCGRSLPRLEKVTGRVSELFILPNGILVPGVTLTGRIVKVCPGLRKTQIIQETETLFTVRYVPGSGFVESDLDNLRSNLKTMLGEGLVWRFERVEDIARERSGKTRFCISRVAR